jgi:hypothetical protein
MAKLTTAGQFALWQQLEEVQKTFPNTEEGFLLFAQTVINTLIAGNPDINLVQADMCKYLFGGQLYRMLQAQRGQAKTTLAAIYAVFRIIHAPHTRVLIFSQKGKRAKEISGWCIKIIRGLDFLNFMLPDTYNGDRESVEAFDIHWALKGSDKSPSIACESIEAGAQGARADVLIADDIESLQNSKTVNSREILEETSKEFESICTHGDIIYLGTPQSIESIYINLPLRGYSVRIWPGRFPTEDELASYGEYLAPLILEMIKADPSLQVGGGLTGRRGKPTCPEMFDDDLLCKKELSQGAAKFDLQFMLNTKLTDDGRFPLKLSSLVISSFNMLEAPVMPIWGSAVKQICNELPKFGNRKTDKFFRAIEREYEYRKYERKIMYIDPAGGGKNGDEMAYAIIGLIGSFIYLLKWGGVPGGYEEENLLKLVEAAKDAGVNEVFVEKNYGNGAHLSMLKPLFQDKHPVMIEGVQEAGQKELRIIDVLEPVVSSHRLIVAPDIIYSDIETIQQYPTDKRMRYSGFFQFGHITRDKDCLAHDDRLDALAGAVRQVVESIDYDMAVIEAKKKKEEYKRWLEIQNDPLKRREEMTGVAQPKGPCRNRFSSIGSRFPTTKRFR